MIGTERLILRNWKPSDLEPWAALNADPEVMEHFPATLTRVESDAMAAVHQDLIARQGWGLWAVERREDGAFLGFTGLKAVPGGVPFAPAVEVAWRLARHAWGAGYASEAARAALAHGFEALKLPEIVSFTATVNLRSQAVMQRIGLTRREDLDFDHPALPKGHRLERHVVWVGNP
jgi:RimJ/RimL family protein N-acetyltransferase